MALKKYDDFQIPKILNFKFIRYLNALFGVSKLVSFRRNYSSVFILDNHFISYCVGN
jgi:hypothetical protein